jgi:glycerol-3-phosphate acyltransferase PlsY
MILILLFIGSFFLGSIPFGLLIGRARGVDIRNEGSGNIGATNVWRILGPGWGTVSFLLDVAKGAIAALVCGWLHPGAFWIFSTGDAAVAGGVLAVAGHMLSPFVGFKGGKGIATGLGALLGTAPLVGLSGFAVFIGAMLMCRIVSLSSLIAVIAIMAFAFYFRQSPFFLVTFGTIGLYVYYKHIPNIKRLLKGEEPTFKIIPKPKAEETKTEVKKA